MQPAPLLTQNETSLFMNLRLTHSNETGTLAYTAPCQATIVEQNNYRHLDGDTGTDVSNPYRIISTTSHCATHNQRGFTLEPTSARLATASEIATGKPSDMWEVYDSREVPSADPDGISSYLLFLYAGTQPSHEVAPFLNKRFGGPCDITGPLTLLSQPAGFDAPLNLESITGVVRKNGPIPTLATHDRPFSYLLVDGSARPGDSGAGLRDRNGVTCAFAEGGVADDYVIAIEYPDLALMQTYILVTRDAGLDRLDKIYGR